MARHPVDSSLIRSVGYDPASSILRVELLAGAVYDYFDVPYSTFAEFLAADSKGGYFNDYVKDLYAYEVAERVV